MSNKFPGTTWHFRIFYPKLPMITWIWAPSPPQLLRLLSLYLFLIGSFYSFAIQNILSLLSFPLLWALEVLALLHRKYFNYFLMHFTYSECSLNCVSVVQIWTEFVRFTLHHELKIWIRVSKSGFRNSCASIWVTEPSLAALVWINHLNYSIIRP